MLLKKKSKNPWDNISPIRAVMGACGPAQIAADHALRKIGKLTDDEIMKVKSAICDCFTEMVYGKVSENK